ncbi:MAG TPA: exosome complex RNA-binding protein Rrp4 [Thermoplasmata archaeon]|nr:exosome complex RNA-binding protein Rrp4 [Thermoplasmata archaeon]HUJ77500.1 exosome complex RNA-binding protein Rrp4 [Thermoplasmata archaeon]
MGHRHRSGPRSRGRDRGAPPNGELTLVLPGEEIPAGDLRPGPGTYRVHGRIYASVLGLLKRRPPVVQVVPLSGRYIPRPGDTVVGTVTDVQGTFWLLDIGAPRWAPLHMTGTPWKIDYGETERYLRVGDSVLVQVENIEATGRIGVTMNGEGLGKLEGGSIVTISPAKVARVIGRGGSMIETIQRSTGCRLTVGQNGRIHVDGPTEQAVRVRETLRLIDDEGHRSGLTERVEDLLASHGSAPPDGPVAPRRHDDDPAPPEAAGPDADPEFVPPGPDEYE